MSINAAISGSHGFLGSHLVNKLMQDGVNVLRIERETLRNKVLLKAILEQFQPSLIFHLAAYGNLIHQQDEEETIQANVYNLVNLLNATKNIQYTNFINFSSSSVTLPVPTLYSATKAAGERLCEAYAAKYGKPIVSVKPYTVVGIGEHREHLIPQLIESCLTGKQIRFVADPTHDFIGVNDFIDAVRLIIENYYRKGSIEICTGIKTTNREVLEMVEKACGKKAKIIPVDSMRSYDSKNWVGDPTIIKSLGWTQKESLQDVINSMVSYEQQRQSS